MRVSRVRTYSGHLPSSSHLRKYSSDILFIAFAVRYFGFQPLHLAKFYHLLVVLVPFLLKTRYFLKWFCRENQSLSGRGIFIVLRFNVTFLCGL